MREGRGALRGRARAFSVAPRSAASWRLPLYLPECGTCRWGGDFFSRHPRGPGSPSFFLKETIPLFSSFIW